jgi:hypothetical protein
MILDPSEFTPFMSFNAAGVTTGDTFNSWRKKCNGVIQLFNNINAASDTITLNLGTGVLDIKNDGVKTFHIDSLAVTSGKLAAGAVTESKVAANAVTESKVAAGAISTSKVVNLAITADKLASNAVTESKVAAGAISTSKVVNLAITADKLASNAVTESKVAANAVTESKVADNAISTDKVVNLAITADKLASNAVTESKVAANAVTTNKVANLAITADKLSSNSVITSKIANGAVTAAKLSGAQGGSAPVFGARLYVSFDGSLGAVIDGEFRCSTFVGGNILNVIRIDTGIFEIRFFTNMQNNAYSVVATASSDPNDNTTTVRVVNRLISSVRVRTRKDGVGLYNPEYVSVVIFQ